MEAEAPPRRSRRLISIQTTEATSRQKRQVIKPPLIIISDSEDDENMCLGLRPTRNTPHKVSPKKQATSPFKEPSRSPKNIHAIPRTPNKTRSQSRNDDALVTPPKMRKTGDENNHVLTPSTLLERLSFTDDPKTNRKKLFDDNDLYKNARRALHSSCPTNMPGREKELMELREFIWGHVRDGTSGTLYISGPPGTGKTASLNLILECEQIMNEIKHVYVNCTSIKSSGSIFARILKDLGVKAGAKNERECVEAIEKFLRKTSKTILLVLDEIDQLESKRQSILYTIFEWPSLPDSRLLLIGIANALDLTDRILPRLQARCELKPRLMHFAPYTKQQIIEIFTTRLQNAGVLDIFSPVALQMLAGKVAAVSGDVRRALDIGRRVIELVDKKKKGENVLQSVENLAEELDKGCEETKKIETVGLGQVVSVLNNVYGTSHSLSEEDDAFPLQQKIVVCSLLLILKKAKNKDVTVGRLYEVYRKACAKRNIQVVDHGEFVGLCSLVETRGILKIIKKKDPRMSKVSLVWDEEEVGGALKDKQLLSQILQDDTCLGKL